MNEYRFLTPDGRTMIWSAHDEADLQRYAASRGYRIIPGSIELYSEYVKEVEVREAQEKLNHELEGDAA